MDIERVNIFLLIPMRLHFAASAFYGNEDGSVSLCDSLNSNPLKWQGEVELSCFIPLFNVPGPFFKNHLTWHL